MDTHSVPIDVRKAPRVTVLMAVYNGAAYLRQAIESILAQTYRDFEFLIINDGSTDASPAIVASYGDSRIHLLQNPQNIGLTRSLNRGLAAARGELIARQDADDVSHPTRLAKQVEFLSANPDVVLVGTQGRYINAKGLPRSSHLWFKATTNMAIRFQSIFDSPFFHTSVMFRRSTIWSVLGGYNENFRTSQDAELWARVIDRYEARNLAEVLVDQRTHSQSVSASYTAANARRVEGVFHRNLTLVLGDARPFNSWPSQWIRATNPQIPGQFEPIAVLDMACNIFRRVHESSLDSVSRDEIRFCFANKLMFMAALLARRDRVTAAKALARALSLNPLAAAVPLYRTVAAIILGNWLGRSRQRVNDE